MQVFKYFNKLKLVLVQLIQQNPVPRVSKSYKLKYAPFDYFVHYTAILYVWADIRLGPHTSDHDQNGGNKKWSNMSPSNVTWPFDINQSSQRLTSILNKFHYKTNILIHRIHYECLFQN